MYNLTKERGEGVIYFNYLDDETVREGIDAGRLFKGTFHANQDNIREGRVNLHVRCSNPKSCIDEWRGEGRANSRQAGH